MFFVVNPLAKRHFKKLQHKIQKKKKTHTKHEEQEKDTKHKKKKKRLKQNTDIKIAEKTKY